MTGLLRMDFSTTKPIVVRENLVDAATGDGMVEKIVDDQSFEKGSFSNNLHWRWAKPV